MRETRPQRIAVASALMQAVSICGKAARCAKGGTGQHTRNPVQSKLHDIVCVYVSSQRHVSTICG